MEALLAEFLKSGTGNVRLSENDDEIALSHCSDRLLFSIQLTQHPPDTTQLMTWLRLGGASLDHFQGALAQAPADGTLWLIQCLHDRPNAQRLQTCIESLLNQRDTWRATVARVNKPAQQQGRTSLRSSQY